jgi:hypothetical protein
LKQYESAFGEIHLETQQGVGESIQ